MIMSLLEDREKGVDDDDDNDDDIYTWNLLNFASFWHKGIRLLREPSISILLIKN